MRKLWNHAFFRKILVKSDPSTQGRVVYEEPFASLLDSQEGVGSHTTIVDLIDRYANRVSLVPDLPISL